MNLPERFKSYPLWVAIFALIGIVGQKAGIITVPTDYDNIVSGLLSVLALAGIINNPVDGKGFRDIK